VAPYSFRSVSRKFCPRARLVVLHATRVVDVARVAGSLKFAVLTNMLDRFRSRTRTSKTTWKWRVVPMCEYSTPFSRRLWRPRSKICLFIASKRRDIHARAFVGFSAGSARKLKSWFLWRHIDKNKCIFLVFPSVKFFKTSHTFL
jgi:hypothetical protein